VSTVQNIYFFEQTSTNSLITQSTQLGPTELFKTLNYAKFTQRHSSQSSSIIQDSNIAVEYTIEAVLSFLQRVSIEDCRAERCMYSYDRFRPSARPSVSCLSVCHSPVSCQNGSSYDHAVLLEDSPMIPSFLVDNFTAKLQTERMERGRRMKEG